MIGNQSNLAASQPRIVERDASLTPQTAQTAYFTVSGRVLITQIVGEVTVNLGSGANTFQLYSNPTVGADVTLCATVDTDGDLIGNMYNITGTLGDAMVSTASGAFAAQVTSIEVSAGTIDLKASASKAGQTKWTIHYIPLDDGSLITTA